MAVRVIPARRENLQRQGVVKAALRVAAYCRVSTDSDDQETSYEAQISHYTDYISNHDGWILAGIYADEGISGTSTAKREQFKQMMRSCERKEVDLVITKSISRWARNTLDSLQTIRKLKSLGIPVIFEKEGCNTMEASGELLITILSSLAQQESQSISQNVRMGLQYRFQQGRPMLNHTLFMGYTKKRGDEELTIVPEEARVIRRIFRDFIEGYTLGEIKERLEAAGVRSPAGYDAWYVTTIASILKNEKYMGDLLLQKYYTADFLTKEKVRNNGRFPQYYVENAHPPIVPREVFHCAQGILIRRERYKIETGKRIRKTSHNALSGRVCCERCGNIYRRLSLSYKTVWRCKTRLLSGSCDARTVSEKEAHEVIAEAFAKLPEYRSKVIGLEKQLQHELMREKTEELDGIEKLIQKRESELNDLSIAGESEDTVLVYDKNGEVHEEFMMDHLRREISDLMEKRLQCLADLSSLMMRKVQLHSLKRLIDGAEEYEETDPACYDLYDFYNRTDNMEAELQDGYSEELMKRYVDSLRVNEDWMTVCFKSGLEIRIDR